MKTIKEHLKSCSPKNDVWVYSFNGEEVKEIEEALQQKSLVSEIADLLKEEEG